MKKIMLIFLIVIFGQNIRAQAKQQCQCCGESYNSFDFWIGDWTVYNVNGKIVGKNTIEKQYSNCVLQEKWTSVGKNRGTSYNYYNKKDSTWNQIWIDNSGFSLVLKGNYIDGKMILKSGLLEGENGRYYNQITWTKNHDDSVIQVWDIFNEQGEKTQESFRGIYKKSVKTSKN